MAELRQSKDEEKEQGRIKIWLRKKRKGGWEKQDGRKEKRGGGLARLRWREVEASRIKPVPWWGQPHVSGWWG